MKYHDSPICYDGFTTGITMAAFRKVSGGWQAQVCKRGIRKAATFRLKSEAITWSASIEADISAQKAGTIPNKTVSDVLDEYEKKVSPTKKGYAWEVKRIRVLKTYKIASVRLSELDATHVAKWRDERLQDVSGSSVCRDWNLLSHALETARKEWKWINHNPFKNEVTRPKVNPPRVDVFTDEEIQRLALTLDGGEIGRLIKDIFMLALETAMRAGEIVGIRKDDIHETYVHLPETKNGSPRKVPLSQKAREILSRYPDGFGLTSRQLDANFRRAKKLAGIDKCFHTTRHTATTRLAKILPVMELAAVTGHKDLKMLMRYYHPSVEEIAGKL